MRMHLVKWACVALSVVVTAAASWSLFNTACGVAEEVLAALLPLAMAAIALIGTWRPSVTIQVPEQVLLANTQLATSEPAAPLSAVPYAYPVTPQALQVLHGLVQDLSSLLDRTIADMARAGVVAKQSGGSVDRAVAAVEQTVRSVAAISSYIETSLSTYRSLAGQAASIGGIVDTIHEIAITITPIFKYPHYNIDVHVRTFVRISRENVRVSSKTKRRNSKKSTTGM